MSPKTPTDKQSRKNSFLLGWDEYVIPKLKVTPHHHHSPSSNIPVE